ncbi:MAG: hypothetical protein LBJ35_06665 [Spirochaetaceae bacterium]|nr:hypothetical protein [Spirochaetaceae bacterium]
MFIFLHTYAYSSIDFSKLRLNAQIPSLCVEGGWQSRMPIAFIGGEDAK